MTTNLTIKRPWNNQSGIISYIYIFIYQVPYINKLRIYIICKHLPRDTNPNKRTHAQSSFGNRRKPTKESRVHKKRRVRENKISAKSPMFLLRLKYQSIIVGHHQLFFRHNGGGAQLQKPDIGVGQQTRVRCQSLYMSHNNTTGDGREGERGVPAPTVRLDSAGPR